MTIEEARRLRAEGAFMREIANHTPMDVFTDTVTLSCGHTMHLGAGLVEIYHSMGRKKIECSRCIEDAMAKQD